MIRGATSSAITPGIGVATGMQDNFSWIGVAAAGIGTGIGGAVLRSLSGDRGNFVQKDTNVTNPDGSISTLPKGSWQWDSAPSLGAQIVSGAARTIAEVATHSAMSGENFGRNLVRALPSIIGSIGGQALGDRFGFSAGIFGGEDRDGIIGVLQDALEAPTRVANTIGNLVADQVAGGGSQENARDHGPSTEQELGEKEAPSLIDKIKGWLGISSGHEDSKLKIDLPDAKPASGEDIINMLGDDAAKKDFAAGKKVVVGLRNETNVRDSLSGAYDDTILVAWKDDQGRVRYVSLPTTTEPSGNYGEYPGATRAAKGSTVDMNGDGVYDTGRLMDGDYRYTKGQSAHLGTVYRPDKTTPVERDTNHDGWFNSSDSNRIDSKGAGRSVLFHAGSRLSTGSAACQTMTGANFSAFQNLLGSQKSFSYVLITNKAHR